MKTPARFPAIIACLQTFLFATAVMLCLRALHAQTAGTLDAGYNPDLGAGIFNAAVQPDGKTIVVGSFMPIGSPAHVNVARLNGNGGVEAAFSTLVGSQPLPLPTTVYSAVVQADGKILICGDFNTVNHSTRNHIARLNANGSLESATTFNVGTGANGIVYCVAVQADGRILLGGSFSQVNGATRNCIARLNSDGSIEGTATFNPGTGTDGSVSCVAVQDDGKILLGGGFTTINGTPINGIARLNADGSLESTVTFNPGTGPNNYVYSMSVQTGGKILLGGSFTRVNGANRIGIARLNADGSLDSTSTFNVGTGTNGTVYSLAVQADGKILLSGDFTSINGTTRNHIARLNVDGSVEGTATFNSSTDASVICVALQADGKILLGGGFNQINGTARALLARLNNDAPTQSLTAPDATRVQWLRGGAGPEVSQVTFELSTNGGSTWTALGAATRIVGGWQRTGLNLPASGSLRARGRTASGASNGSSGLIEATITFPPTPIQPWKYAHLGDNTAPDLADPDHDGLPTLAEYGLVLLPETPSQPPGASVFTYAEGDRLRMFVSRDPAHNDITVTVEATGDLVTGPWTALATSTLGAPFTGPGYVGGDDATPGVKTVEVRDLVNLSAATQRWLRVKVMH